MYSEVSWRRCGKPKRNFGMEHSGNKHLNMKPGILRLSQHNFFGKQIPFVYNTQQHASAFTPKPTPV
jgi:hypothetical protein